MKCVRTFTTRFFYTASHTHTAWHLSLLTLCQVTAYNFVYSLFPLQLSGFVVTWMLCAYTQYGRGGASAQIRVTVYTEPVKHRGTLWAGNIGAGTVNRTRVACISCRLREQQHPHRHVCPCPFQTPPWPGLF